MNKFRHYRDAEAGTDFRDEAPLTAKHLADESRSLLWHAAFFSSSAGLPYGWIPGKDAAWPHFEKGEFVVPASTLFRLRNGVVVRVDGLKRIQATGDDRVWLVVDYADPAQATPDCERSRFNLKLTKDSPPDDC